ncbi:MAG: hypothetical protein IJO54_08750 [Oscillospiraceae bacterium]|nr:hypothetical protein [Oscillospiraceae bacterium]
MKKTTRFFCEYGYVIISALIGLIAFISIYGIGTLDVTNDTWIITRYNESDIVQHYTGWINYRNSPWEFPLGNSSYMAYPDGGNIAFSDSIPLLAILFKALSPVLPEVFQYLGITILISFILQGISSSLLIHELTKNKILAAISSVFFVLSPILLERSFRHSALSAHYLILFAMYIYFKYRSNLNEKNNFNKLPFGSMAALCALSVGITPYFLPMVMIFVFVLSINYVCARFSLKDIVKATIFFLICVCTAYLTGVLIGTLGQGINTSRGGFGKYSMNLNAVINPYSLGGYTWSQFMSPRAQAEPQYDGFNYIGCGMLLFLLFSAVCAIINFIKGQAYLRFVKAVKENFVLLCACIFLTLFALSHIIYFGGLLIIEIPLPDILLNLCGIFRASSRMFWPVFYLIFTFAITCTFFVFKKYPKIVYVITTFFLALQIYDLKGVLVEKHIEMQEKLTYEFPGDPELFQLGDYELVIDDYSGSKRYVCYISGRNNIMTTSNNFNSGSYPNAIALCENELRRIETEPLNIKYVYVTNDIEKYELWQKQFADTANFYTWKRNEHETKVLRFMVPVQKEN